MTNEQLAIYLAAFQRRLLYEIQKIEAALPDDIPRETIRVRREDVALDFPNFITDLNDKYYKDALGEALILDDLREFASEINSDIDTLIG